MKVFDETPFSRCFPQSLNMEYKQATKPLSKHWKVEKKHETCYTGGQVEYMVDTNSLACLCNGNIAFLNLETGEVTSVLVDENVVRISCISSWYSPNIPRKSRVLRSTQMERRLLRLVEINFFVCGICIQKPCCEPGRPTTHRLQAWHLILLENSS